MIVDPKHTHPDYEFDRSIKAVDNRVVRASKNSEAAEVVSILINDVAESLYFYGHDKEARECAIIARHVADMNGMRDKRTWWQALTGKDATPTDYSDIIWAYRTDNK